MIIYEGIEDYGGQEIWMSMTSILSLLDVCCFIWVVTVSWDSHFSSLPKHIKAWSMTSGEFSDASGKLVTRYHWHHIHWQSFSDNQLIKPCTMFRRVPREQHRRNSWEPGGFIVVLFCSEASILNWLVYTNLAMIAMEIDPFVHPDKPGSFICTFYQWYCILSPLKRLRLDFPSKFHPAMCYIPNSLAAKTQKRISRPQGEGTQYLGADLRPTSCQTSCRCQHSRFLWGRSRGEHCRSYRSSGHSTLKKQAKCIKNGDWCFGTLKRATFLFEPPKRCQMWLLFNWGMPTVVIDRSWTRDFFGGLHVGVWKDVFIVLRVCMVHLLSIC